MAKCVEKLMRLAATVRTRLYFCMIFRQDYEIDNYDDSAIGLAGAAIPKKLSLLRSLFSNISWFYFIICHQFD